MDRTETVEHRTEAVERYYRYVDAGAHDDLVDLFAPDVVYRRPGHEPIEGRGELRRFYEEERPLSDGTHELATVVADGDTVAVRGTFEGTQGGEPVSFGFADFHAFEDGRIARRYSFTDRDEV